MSVHHLPRPIATPEGLRLENAMLKARVAELEATLESYEALAGWPPARPRAGLLSRVLRAVVGAWP
jgi:hypothetical protein